MQKWINQLVAFKSIANKWMIIGSLTNQAVTRTSSPTPHGHLWRNKLPSETVLLIYYHLIFLSFQDMSHRMFIEKMQDKIIWRTFLLLLLTFLTQRRHCGRPPANRLGTADTKVCHATQTSSCQQELVKLNKLLSCLGAPLGSPPRPSRTEVLPSLWLMNQNLTRMHRVIAEVETFVVGMT